MSSRIPNFYRLYRRSRYSSRRNVDQDGDESEEIRRDRERFVTAALAFTLKHSRPFLEDFWKKICRVRGGDPTTMPKISREDILLEPPAWADLQLKSEDGDQKFVWVVEVKVGAKLDPKQDPGNEAAFLKAGEGYGWHLSNAHKQTKLRYIILCLDGQLPGENSAGLICQIHTLVRTWKQVAEIVPRDKLTSDLFESFGQLGIYPFGLDMKMIEKIAVTNGLSAVDKAHKVLDAVRMWLNAPDSKAKWEFYGYPEGGAELGVYVLGTRSRFTSAKFARLQKLTRPPKEVAWFGYIIDKDNSIKRGVWVYCKDESKQNDVLKCLKRQFGEKAERDAGALCVRVSDTCAPQPKVRDFTWFKSVFEEVEKLAKDERLAKGRR